MGLVMDIAAKQRFANLPMTEPEWSEMRRQCIDRAKGRMQQQELIYLTDQIYQVIERHKQNHGRNLGVQGVNELLMSVGVLLASLTDREFEDLLERRKWRKRVWD